MTVTEVVEQFCKGYTTGAASKDRDYPKGRLRIEGNKLINYSTVIAYRFNGFILLNTTHYSKTTTRHQNRIRYYADKLIEVDEGTLDDMMAYGHKCYNIIREMIESEN